MTTSIASFYYDTMMIVLWREIILFRNKNWKERLILNTKKLSFRNVEKEAFFVAIFRAQIAECVWHSFSLWRRLWSRLERRTKLELLKKRCERFHVQSLLLVSISAWRCSELLLLPYSKVPLLMCSWVSYQAAAPTLCCIENQERNRPVVEKQGVEKSS